MGISSVRWSARSHFLDEGVDVVELRDFDEEGGDGGRAAGDELQVADGSEEGGAAALGILPAFALLKAKGGKEAVSLSKSALVAMRRLH